MKKNLILALLLVFGGSMVLNAQVDIPPVSDPVIVAEYCLHCGWVEFEKGQTHRADCPYVNGNNGGKGGAGTSGRSSSTIDPALSAAVSAMGNAIGEAMVASFDRGSAEYAAGSMTHYEGVRPGDTNGNFVVGRNGRHGRVGMFDNDSDNRWWKIGPIYRDLVIYDLESVIAVRGNRVGVLDASGKRVTKVQPFKYNDFKVLYHGGNRKPVYALARKEGDRTLWTIWRGNERLIADEFENVMVTGDGIVTEVGDRFQVFDFNGRLKMIVSNKKQ